MNSPLNKLFAGRTLLIATKHKKERVISPIFEKEFGVHCVVSQNFDTDLLGTFSGEIERKKSPLETVKEKCLLAMEANQCDLAIANEGSFGPHPTLFFIPADDEYLIFIDKKNNLEIVARIISTDTNFCQTEIKKEEELAKFAQEIGFPSHGVLLKRSGAKDNLIRKDFASLDQLVKAYNELNDNDSTITLETDMRAMRNPTRMKVIEETAHQLAKKIKSTCPSCKTPGFSITDSKKGLPCSLCGSPTNSTLLHTYRCLSCDYSEDKMYPNDVKTEDPMYCNFCNP